MTMRMDGTSLAAVLAVVLFGSGALAQQTLTLADLERMALEYNPTVSQSAADLKAVRGRAHQAGIVPNPIVGYTGEEISGGPIIRGGEHGFFVEQTIPLGGKLGRSRRVFELEAEEIEAGREMQRQRVLTDVRALYYASLASDRRIAEWERLAALTAEAVQVSAQLANVGAADRPDRLETEIEAARTGLSLSVARQSRERIVRLLGVMVGDPMLHSQQLAGSIDDTLPELTHEEVLGRLLSDSPELTIARLAVARGRASVERAERTSAPDLIVRGWSSLQPRVARCHQSGRTPSRLGSGRRRGPHDSHLQPQSGWRSGGRRGSRVGAGRVDADGAFAACPAGGGLRLRMRPRSKQPARTAARSSLAPRRPQPCTRLGSGRWGPPTRKCSWRAARCTRRARSMWTRSTMRGRPSCVCRDSC